MALVITYTDKSVQEDQDNVDAWLPGVVASPASITWEVVETLSFYTAKDVACDCVVHIVKSGTPTSVDVGDRNVKMQCRLLGTATGEDFTALQAHLAGLV